MKISLKFVFFCFRTNITVNISNLLTWEQYNDTIDVYEDIYELELTALSVEFDVDAEDPSMRLEGKVKQLLILM